MRSRNAILIVVALVGFAPLSAHPIELKLVAGDDPDADQHVTLDLSETGMVSIYMTMFEGDGNVTHFIAFMDATPLRSEEAVGYDLMDNIFKMERDDGTRWIRRIGGAEGRNIETDYALIASDDHDGRGPGTNAPWEGVVESLIIHGTEIGEYDLYFENSETAEGDPRPPGLFALDLIQHNYAVNLQIPTFIWFKNAWADRNANGGDGFDVPFIVAVIPEPASLALLAAMSLIVVGKRRR